MHQLLENLWNVTDDLLYRVRIYDRNLAYSDEIVKMDELHRKIDSLRVSDDERLLAFGVDKLKEMRSRLLTMMEDLLFTA
ncbi:hypothetical protein [Cohnella thailandensis]|uniref:Uncharacterized protein n=1 Tax=Cohnella thailandensis TaxID=557557 RepID=A0A841T5D9_9BACL|nr:hypothetical protein [Cohnella thailandensis]MBB6636351.1 hypothetical protein [Cohnella thailandensis]MBP1973679.1 hypothetical protein [Cohnella thailandensis]